MTEFEARSTHLKTTTFTTPTTPTNRAQNSILGLKKANLYSPHVSLKTMNKSFGHTNTNSNNIDDDEDNLQHDHDLNHHQQEQDLHTNLDEDIYDFSNVKRNLNATDHALNYADEEDEEEEDINFDYEYGYDYERIIKDRLRKANQDFVNDSEPSKRKSIVVSFDAAVTAIDIPNDTRPESTTEEEKVNYNLTQQKKLAFSSSKSVRIGGSGENDADDDKNQHDNNRLPQQQEQTNSHAKKVPLNDTVKKEDPDAFANKIKQAVMRYDSEMIKQQQQMVEQANKLNEINDYFRESLTDYSDNSSTNANYKNDYRDDDFEDDTSSHLNTNNNNNNNIIKDSINSSSPILNTNSTTNNKIIKNLKSSTPSPPPPQQQPPPQPTIVPEISETKLETNNDSLEIIEDDNDTKLKVPKQSNNKVPSFSASSKSNEASPSPIASFESSHEPAKSHELAQTDLKQEITQQNKPFNDTNESASSSSAASSSDKHSNEFTNSDTTRNEKMLIEKDGIFKLMSPEEYTAYEKQKQLERQEKQQSNKKLFSLLPHPPANQRPKTSIYPSNRNLHIKNRLVNNQQQQQQQNTQQPQSIIRYSQSADPSGRRINNQVTVNQRTPDYAQDYKSPYHVQFKVVKPAIDLAEEKKKREKEEEERRQNNDLAYKAWLKQKEKQRAEEEQKLKQKQDKLKNDEYSNSTNNSDDNKNTYEYWLIRKREQLDAEREFKKKLELLEQQDRKTVTPEERSKAFRDWIARKIKEKNEALKLEKLEQKKWIARRRRSRKHQRLSQALELAQAYGYNSSFYSPGFNF